MIGSKPWAGSPSPVHLHSLLAHLHLPHKCLHLALSAACAPQVSVPQEVKLNPDLIKVNGNMALAFRGTRIQLLVFMVSLQGAGMLTDEGWHT